MIPPREGEPTADGVLLTADQVIERLSEYPWLRSAAATCVLPAIRVGEEWLFRARDLDAWINAARPGSRPGSDPRLWRC